MIFCLSQILRDIRIRLNLNPVSPLVEFPDYDKPNLDIDTAIRSLIEEAAAAILLEAPLGLLEPTTRLTDPDIFRSPDGSGWIPLPDDFLRLVRFRMSDWARPVIQPIAPDSLLYARQWSEWAGIRGNPDRPVVAIVNRPEGLALEYFSCRDPRATVAEALYLPRPVIDRYDSIDLPAHCYSSFLNRVASLFSVRFNS